MSLFFQIALALMGAFLSVVLTKALIQIKRIRADMKKDRTDALKEEVRREPKSSKMDSS